MKNKIDKNIKLGAFVLAGAAFLFLLLFMIGKNKNLFGNTYVLKARFQNVQGLVPGNNVRYAGIQAGTVKDVSIVNDTTIEVVMNISTKMKSIIRSNAVVSIGTEGFVGNKVINIVAGSGVSQVAAEGSLLHTAKSIDTEKMLQTLQGTNEDVAMIAGELKKTVMRLNDSKALWTLLNDEAIPREVRLAAINIRSATAKANTMVSDLEMIVAGVKEGRGSMGKLLMDSSFALNLDEAIRQVNETGQQLEELTDGVNSMVTALRKDMDNGNGPLHALLKDSSLVNKLAASLDNIQKGTDGFNQNMEALKHNFLLRGYFRKQEKKEKRMLKQSPSNARAD